MARSFDLIVLGTGAGGGAPATKCRRAGWSVAVIDDQPYGGTCAVRGCDPKKVLIGAAEAVDWHRRMSGSGVAGEAGIDWPALMRFKSGFTDAVPAAREKMYREAGIATYHGPAKFLSRDQVELNGEILASKHFLIASGAAPAKLGIPGESHVITSTEFLELESLPARIAFIGAGYISFEFAHLIQRAGSQAVMLGRSRPLNQFDADLVDRLVSHSREIGIQLHLDAAVTGVERTEGGYSIAFQTSAGEDRVSADLVVHGAGRTPNTAVLDPAAGGIAIDKKGGVAVNEFLQSISNERVYAAGDVALPAGSIPLTPVAAHEGHVAAANLLRGNHARPGYAGIPSVVFTIPPLAAVGLTEAEAKNRGHDLRVKSEDTAGWYASRRVREPAAMFKTIVDARTDLVLGAHLLGPHAEEVVNLFGLAIRHGITAGELRRGIYAYPTSSSDIAYMV